MPSKTRRTSTPFSNLRQTSPVHRMSLVFFQIVNLPVEFDASNRAKRLLGQLNIIDGEGAIAVRSVLNAAGWTYVAATLQSILTLLYYLFRFSGNRDD